MPRLWILSITLLLGASSVWGQVPSTAPMNAAAPLDRPVSWTGSYIPVVVNDPRFQNVGYQNVGLQNTGYQNTGVQNAAFGNTNATANDPYALVAVRRSLPWLGGTVGAAPIPAPSATRLGANGGIFGSRFGLLGNRPRLFDGSLLSGQRLNNGGNSFQSGRLFPGVSNAIDSRLWLRGEWLYWDTEGMDSPVLVTTSTDGTPRATAGVLGESGVSNVFGGGKLNGSTMGGFRIAGGFWTSPQQNFAIEAEYMRLNEQNTDFRGNSDGSVILARPFFDIVAGQETAQLISFPDLVSGSINVDVDTNFNSFLLNGRAALCPGNGCNSCGLPDRVDLIVGYRRVELDDSVTVSESLTSQVPTAPGTINLTDRFQTENEFNGLQLGVVHRTNLQRAWLESMLRVALGNNEQTVKINGAQSITEAGFTEDFNSGLLALNTNSGTHRRDEFSMIPEVGIRLGGRLTDRLSASVGYSVIYFPNVVRAGDQIETDINTGRVEPDGNNLGPDRPRFEFVESDYWAHGLTLGGELNF